MVDITQGQKPMSVADVAAMFDVSEKTVFGWMEVKHDEAYLHSGKMGGKRFTTLERIQAYIVQSDQEQPAAPITTGAPTDYAAAAKELQRHGF